MTPRTPCAPAAVDDVLTDDGGRGGSAYRDDALPRVLGRREIPVDVAVEVQSRVGKDADRATGACRHDRCVGHDRTLDGIDRRHIRLRRTGWPDRDERVQPVGKDRPEIHRIGLDSWRYPAARAAVHVEVADRVREQARAPVESVGVARIEDATRRHGHERDAGRDVRHRAQPGRRVALSVRRNCPVGDAGLGNEAGRRGEREDREEKPGPGGAVHGQPPCLASAETPQRMHEPPFPPFDLGLGLFLNV